MGRPTPAHRLPATTSTHPEARRCRPTCQPDSAPRRTLTPPTLPHASNRLRTTLRFVAAIPCTPPAHHRTSLLWSPSSDFVPSQPHQLPANTIQSPYIHRANGLLQIAVSTLLRTGSIGPREVLFAEHCRYGTRDFSTTDRDKPRARDGFFLAAERRTHSGDSFRRDRTTGITVFGRDMDVGCASTGFFADGLRITNLPE
jgi:hypothetical protein